jgi:hypothetical protein
MVSGGPQGSAGSPPDTNQGWQENVNSTACLTLNFIKIQAVFTGIHQPGACVSESLA